jgi:RNA methyltransferase, TrmH family
LIRSLRMAKYRKIHGLFLAEGPKIVNELLSGPFMISTILATDDYPEPAPFPDYHIDFIRITGKELEQISLLKTPNQVVALVRIPEEKTLKASIPEGIVLLLDGINDPGNLGSIIRTADWFGVHSIVCSENCVDLYNPKVVQSAMGSLGRVGVYYTSLHHYLDKMAGKTEIFGASLDGNNLYHQSFPSPCVVVIGSESHGISQSLIPLISKMITIPGFKTSSGPQAESLNAAVAAALICSEIRRQYDEMKG